MTNDESAPLRSGKVREKNTAIDETLPPVAQLANGKSTKIRYVDLDGVACTVDFLDVMTKDPHPLPMPVDREDYGTIDSSPRFWATGYTDWLNVDEACARYATCAPQRLLDFGCATCRFLRHVAVFSDIEAHGCDFAPANVNWVKRHLPESLNVVLNTSDPQLPFDDGYFDVVAAFSVLTHIDGRSDDWLLELRRITRPDGLLYLTIQNAATWTKVLDRPGSLPQLLKANQVPGNIEVTPELFSAPMPSDRIVFRMSLADIYNCNVWMSNEYVWEHWTRYFEILHIADNAHTEFQSAVILRPRS